MGADNAPSSFKCEQCGNMFAVEQSAGICPVCGYKCSADSCNVLEASDEGY